MTAPAPMMTDTAPESARVSEGDHHRSTRTLDPVSVPASFSFAAFEPKKGVNPRCVTLRHKGPGSIRTEDRHDSIRVIKDHVNYPLSGSERFEPRGIRM